MFDHILITRFNVIYGGVMVPNDQWMQYRFRLFEQICLPSVMGQTNQDFRWIIYFNDKTSDKSRKKIKELQKQFPFIDYYIPKHLDFDQIKKSFESLFTNGKDYLISSRLDNDDAISRDYIERVQREFKEQDREFINFANGLHRKVETKNCKHAIHFSNPFISLIEKKKNYIGVNSAPHNLVSRNGPVKQLFTEPVWCTTFHGKNLYYRNRLPFVYDELIARYLNRFDIKDYK